MGAGRLGSRGPFGAAVERLVADHEPVTTLVVATLVAPPRCASATEHLSALPAAPPPPPCSL